MSFLHGFLQRFPQYNGRPFWITGESYGEFSARCSSPLSQQHEWGNASASGAHVASPNTCAHHLSGSITMLHACQSSSDSPLKQRGASVSPGGHYVPNLAAAIIDAQRQPADGDQELPHINLQGFLVGPSPWIISSMSCYLKKS